MDFPIAESEYILSPVLKGSEKQWEGYDDIQLSKLLEAIDVILNVCLYKFA